MKATNNFTEMILALSVLDLPLVSDKETVEFSEENNQIILSSKQPLIVFHREMKKSEPIQKSGILVSQNYFNPNGIFCFISLFFFSFFCF